MNLRLCYRVFFIAGFLINCFLLLAFLSLLGLIPSPLWKSLPIYLSQAKTWITHKSFRIIANIAGLSVTSEGFSELPDQPYILLANHVSYWDIIAIISITPINFIAKEEVRSWPFFGPFARMCEVIFVRRDSALSRAQALFSLATRSRRQAYCIFPEGTTTAADFPVWENWFRGNISLAVRPGLPIYTLGLHYRKQREQAAWIGEVSFFPHLLASLGRPRTEIFISLSRLDLDAPDSQKSSLHDLAHRAFLQVRAHCEAAKSLALLSEPRALESFPRPGLWIQRSQ